MSLDMKETGRRIKQKRKELSMTQEKLAERIDVSTHYIYEIESGMKTMSVYTLDAITQALHTSSDYLLYGCTNPSSTDDKIITNSIESKAKNAHSLPAPDQLSLIIDKLSPEKRTALAELLNVLLPFLK